jgi:hypothetical protein
MSKVTVLSETPFGGTIAILAPFSRRIWFDLARLEGRL